MMVPKIYNALKEHVAIICKRSSFRSLLDADEITHNTYFLNQNDSLEELKIKVIAEKNREISRIKKARMSPVKYAVLIEKSNTYTRNRCKEEPEYKKRLARQKSDSAKRIRQAKGQSYQNILISKKRTYAIHKLGRFYKGPINCRRESHNKCNRMPIDKHRHHTICPLPNSYFKRAGRCFPVLENE